MYRLHVNYLQMRYQSEGRDYIDIGDYFDSVDL